MRTLFSPQNTYSVPKFIEIINKPKEPDGLSLIGHEQNILQVWLVDQNNTINSFNPLYKIETLDPQAIKEELGEIIQAIPAMSNLVIACAHDNILPDLTWEKWGECTSIVIVYNHTTYDHLMPCLNAQWKDCEIDQFITEIPKASEQPPYLTQNDEIINHTAPTTRRAAERREIKEKVNEIIQYAKDHDISDLGDCILHCYNNTVSIQTTIKILIRIDQLYSNNVYSIDFCMDVLRKINDPNKNSAINEIRDFLEIYTNSSIEEVNEKITQFLHPQSHVIQNTLDIEI